MIYTALILCIHFIETNMIKYPPPFSHVNSVRDDLIITPHISKHLYHTNTMLRTVSEPMLVFIDTRKYPWMKKTVQHDLLCTEPS